MSNISSVIAIAKKAGDAILTIYHADDFDYLIACTGLKAMKIHQLKIHENKKKVNTYITPLTAMP